MSRVEFRGVTVTCQGVTIWDTMPPEPCTKSLTLAGTDRPENHGWGMVRVFDGKWDQNTIGDQNGWNNYDLCPSHYQTQMALLGIDKRNIPVVPPEYDEYEPVYDDRASD